VEMVDDLLAEELQSTFSSQVGYLLSRRAYRRFRRRVDYSEYGGAPLMGVAGLCIVGHGRSSAKAVRNAVAMAARFATSDVLSRVVQEIGSLAVTPARSEHPHKRVEGPALSDEPRVDPSTERKRVEG
jgi:phosphate acyltransferase